MTADATSTANASALAQKRCLSSTSASPHLSKRGKIILLGDSITQMSFSATLSGWGSYVADVYQRRCDVYNRGMSGYNTDWFLRYLKSDEGYHDIFGMMGDAITSKTGDKNNSEAPISQKDGDASEDACSNSNTNTNTPVDTTANDESMEEDKKTNNVKLVTIFFGANDSSSKELNPRHHVPIPRFESNLKEIVQKCRESFGDETKIILITPPPVCHKSRLEYQIQRYKEKATGDLERTLSLSGAYAEAVERVAKELKLPCLNIWKDMQESMEGEEKNREDGKEPWSVYLSDGLHFSREGNLFVGERLVDLIAAVYPDIAVSPCPFTNYTGNSSSKGGLALGSEGGIGPWHDEIDHLDVEDSFTNSTKKIKVNL
eukprot:CAMPEP_0203675182 /NCGR_PEP_ID=MMETSP0090-20130426/19281_1 /ASSEMBLY_ACC=CAM_ASM_001088 /TAXON_ID=426623 /ORGANISM="Chaetoceros affinis, Strain CCMP159" /LENGTH=373 /DNA_ID=CAMNT_0050541291 /DNA_START=16 /DNA_END=1137 /DNA_ORIENTATION=+